MQETPTQEPGKRTLITGDAQARKQFLIALGFMIVSILVTLGLYGYTWYQSRQIETLQNEITTTDAGINDVEKKHDVALALLLKETGGVKESINLVDIVKKFRALASSSNVEFQGFTLANNLIKTSLVSTISGDGANRDTVQYIINMADEYVRDQNAESEKNFIMKPIMTITGTPEQRVTSIELEFIDRSSSGSIDSGSTTEEAISE